MGPAQRFPTIAHTTVFCIHSRETTDEYEGVHFDKSDKPTFPSPELICQSAISVSATSCQLCCFPERLCLLDMLFSCYADTLLAACMQYLLA